jgi:Flp pilus assembly protein TadD
VRGTVVVAILFALLARAAFGQPYSGITPVPRTTDPATLHALAREREIVERLRLGIAAIDRADWHVARDEFSRTIALDPREPQASTAYYDLGIALTNLKELREAARAFDAAIARDPGFLAARANLVTVELMRDDLVAARKAADDLIGIAPDSARALYSRGIVALKAGDAASALADFQRLLSHDPKYAVAHYDLALAEQRLGNFEGAERELRAALELVPAYARAAVALGAVLLHEGKNDEARVTFDSAARETDDVALHNLAVSMRDAIAH